MTQRTKKIISLSALVLLVGFIFLLTPQPVSAGDFVADLAQGMFGKLMNAFRTFTASVVDLVAYITAFLITFAAHLINLMIGMSTTIIESPLVKTGFGITLQIANMGFVVAIIVLAFVTIFRLQGYETKKIFRNLILAAILVNFSFTIAGLVMDGSHVFAKFFLTAMMGDTPNVENITANLAHSLNLQLLNTAKPSVDALENAAGASQSFFLMLSSLALTIIYNSAIVITFFTIAGMMFVRYVIISLLLILMPAAWVCWIFPALSSNWKKWWDTFLRWNIFLPVMLFFLYLALVTSKEIGDSMAGASGYSTAKAAAGFSIFDATILTAITQGIVQIGLIFGGLMAANSLGIAGSGFIYNTTKSFAGWATGAGYLQGRWQRGFGGGGGGGGKGPGGPGGGGGGGAPGIFSGATSRMNRLLAGAASYVGAHGTAARLYNAAEAPNVARRNAVTERAKEINSYSKESKMETLKGVAFSSTERAARAMVAVDAKMIDDLDPKKRGEYLQAAKTMGVSKEIIKKRLDLASELGTNVAQATKDWTVKDLSAQDPKSFENSNVVANLNPELIEKIVGGKGFNRSQRESFAAGLASLKFKDKEHENNKYALSPIMRGIVKDLSGKIEKLKPEERTLRHEAMLNLHKFVTTTEAAELAQKKKDEEEKRAASEERVREGRGTSPEPRRGGLAVGEQQKTYKAPQTAGGPSEKIQLKRQRPQNRVVDDKGNPAVT
ncbi:MAG: Uncharacterized protein G01um101419_569 [Parcubacteria group bacterium Gr01-1014_19]|nr:MAG: Uncharacterized protein G01um101419_569 [Parcubacteria group bacterium Gr01-1014_19]